MAIAAINRDLLLPFRVDKECGKGYIEEADTCHIGKTKRQTKAAKRKEEVAKAISEMEKFSVQRLVKTDIENIVEKLDIDDSQSEKAIDDLIEKRSDLLVSHAAQAFKEPKMSAKFKEFAEKEFQDIFLSPEDALDSGWPIRSMSNALESPEKLNLWMRRQVSDWLERDDIYDGSGLPDELFAIANEDDLFKALRKSSKEAIGKVDTAKLYDSLSKYSPLAEKLPEFRRKTSKAFDKAWDDAKAKYPYEMKTVRGKHGQLKRVADNEENRKKVDAASNKEARKWEKKWVQEIEAAGLKVNEDSFTFSPAADTPSDRTDALYGVRFQGRNTSIVVNAEDRSQAISKARKKKRRGGEKAAEVWQLNEQQAKEARAGKWVRTNSKGESRAKQGYRGQGPKPKAYRGDSLLFRFDGQPCGKSNIADEDTCHISGKAISASEDRVYKWFEKEARTAFRRKDGIFLLNVVNLDARKVASSSGRIPGKRCGGSYISASFKCQSHRGANGKLTEEGKASARELASKVRTQRGLKPADSKKDVQKQISDLEDQLKQENIPAPVKVAIRKELKRLRSQSQKKPDLKVIEGGKKSQIKATESDSDIYNVRDINGDRVSIRRQSGSTIVKKSGYVTSFSSKESKEISRSIAEAAKNKTNSSLDKSDLEKTKGFQVKIFAADPIPRVQIIDYRDKGLTSTFSLKAASRMFKMGQESTTESRRKLRNLTQEYDNKIADVRKIEDQQERYNAAQKLQTELRKESSPYSRDATKGIRMKVSNLIRSTRQSAARKEGTQPTRRNAPFAIPTKQAPTRVRGPGGRYYSIDGESPKEKDAKRRRSAKIAKVMGEWKRGELKSGSSGAVVKDKEQAVAIALSEAQKVG